MERPTLDTLQLSSAKCHGQVQRNVVLVVANCHEEIKYCHEDSKYIYNVAKDFIFFITICNLIFINCCI